MKRGERRKKRDMPSPEEQNQVGKRKEQSVDRQVVPRCSIRSPKVTDLEEC
ncbi:hypothetical protein MTR67_018856 [Solanum verrucosum]|uniref:Uncharacterized protein n=1 Tax=Solanum verrucosum TaxID=315347 RepID=A0AAF0QLG8_SOLVR|nr:hypothetical protein MTR67_018856 [Solanum verrucosum]